jgi:hypothetical protein
MTPSLVMNELICRSLKSAHWLCGHFILFFSGSEELILIGHIGTAEALRDGKDAATTEGLRTAMIHCRYL